MQIKSAKDLTVYKRAYELAMEIFHASKHFPAEERYSLTNQLRPFIEVGVFEFTGGLGQTPI
jgi:hypothetical protein